MIVSMIQYGDPFCATKCRPLRHNGYNTWLRKRDSHTILSTKGDTEMNKNTKMLTVSERTANAAAHAEAAKRKLLQERRDERRTMEKKNHRRNYIIGEIFCKYFPEIPDIDPERTQDENASHLEAFISALADDRNLVQMLREWITPLPPDYLSGELSSDGAEEPPEEPNV